MTLDGGTYVVRSAIGDTTCRGVVDTGSPFLTMEGRCTDYWGCLKESDARPSGYGDTYEIYGLQEDGVTRWVLGDARFDGEVVDVTGETVGPGRSAWQSVDGMSKVRAGIARDEAAVHFSGGAPRRRRRVTAKEGSSGSPRRTRRSWDS